MNRRLALTGTSLLALAACGTTPASATSVQKVMLEIQYVLPLLDVLATGVALVVPSAAPAIAAIEPYLGSAAKVFQEISATMTEQQAKPLVDQIRGYLNGAVVAAQGVVAGNPRLAPLGDKLAQARAVLDLLGVFVTGVTAMPVARAAALPYLHR